MAKIATTKKAKANKAKANKVIATKPAMPAEVESYKHKEAKRKNIPTAELQKLVRRRRQGDKEATLAA